MDADPPDVIVTNRRGLDLIAQPMLNKGTAFDRRERDLFGLRGLLPAGIASIDDQVALELEHVRRKDDDLERYIGLAALHDRNETLFYRLLVENLEEFLPIVYTPTVGLACQQFSHIFRCPRGVWITPDDTDRIDDILAASGADVRLIVVTDNERILGLGDQGAGGIAIPVGKLTLYSATAGIHPAWTLPVSLDVGTDRAELLEDPLYVGYRAARLRGEAYDAFVEAFVAAVGRVFPGALIQWEDFKQHNALRIFERYRDRTPSFNDDIQGTGAVVLAGLLAARREGGDIERDRFLLMGAGAAAIGIARMIVHELVARGVDPGDARSRMALLDRHGLVHNERPDLAEPQRAFAVDPRALSATIGPFDVGHPPSVARALGATVLIGATGCPGAFSEDLVRAVGGNDRVPIVLPLSNPSSCLEASAADILEWTEGRAYVATGSPSHDIAFGGACRVIGQANNVFIFPGVGLGSIVAGLRRLDDDVFLVAAHRLADLVTPDRLRQGALYPPISELRSIARSVAISVVEHARACDPVGWEWEPVAAAVERAMWWPDYVPTVPG